MKSKMPPITSLALLGLFCLWFLLFIRSDTTLTSQWVGFGFGSLACVMSLLPWAVTSREYVNQATQLSVGFIFAAMEFVASVVVILIAPQDWQIPLFVLVAVAVVYGVLFGANVHANASTDATQAKTVADRRLQQSWTAQVRPLMTQRDLTPTARKTAERAFDALRSTPVNSAPETFELDDQISVEVQSLLVAAERGDEDLIGETAKRIESLARQRNVLLSGLN